MLVEKRDMHRCHGSRVIYYGRAKESYLFLRELAGIFNDNFGAGRSGSTANPFDGSDDIHAFDNLSKDNVLPIEPRRLRGTQEELTSVGSRSSCGSERAIGCVCE